jgi:large subunit ribosomal protein L6
MSRVGKKPIIVPDNTEVKLTDSEIKVKGPKGELSRELHPLVNVVLIDKQILVTVKDENDNRAKAFWGLYRSLINNMVVGVTEGFSKQLEINGVGFTASISGNKLVLKVGFSHPVEFELPDGIEGAVDKNIITISGIDKQLVGEVAANIRKIRKPEPYKGKGIKYLDEIIRRKVGKAAVKAE